MCVGYQCARCTCEVQMVDDVRDSKVLDDCLEKLEVFFEVLDRGT